MRKLFFNKKCAINCDYFDPKFDSNHYKEDGDFCLNIKKFGKLVLDPIMPVNHLRVNYGGCRQNTYNFYLNITSNTILFILKHKKITLQAFSVMIMNIYGFLKVLILGNDDVISMINRLKLIKSFLKGISLGIKKYFYNLNVIKPQIAIIFKFEYSNLS